MATNSLPLPAALPSDFGLVRHLDNSISKAETFVGTFTYMSPERICGEAPPV
jgi:hypothetical protein